MFDRYVTDKRKKRPLLYAMFVASSIVEGVLITGLIIYSFVHVEEVAPPPITVNFVQASAPPPPPPPPAKRKKAEVKPVIKPLVQPTETPKMVQPVKDDDKPQDEDKGTDDGVEGGVEGGVPGGVVGAAPAPPPPPPPPQKAVIRPAFMVKKDKVGGEMPHLPDVIKAQRKGQTVLGSYKVCIDTSGSVTSVSPVGSIPGADEAITSTLRGWKFKPQAIPVCFVEAFNFIVE